MGIKPKQIARDRGVINRRNLPRLKQGEVAIQIIDTFSATKVQAMQWAKTISDFYGQYPVGPAEFTAELRHQVVLTGFNILDNDTVQGCLSIE
jgi:hypothetical protein